MSLLGTWFQLWFWDECPSAVSEGQQCLAPALSHPHRARVQPVPKEPHPGPWGHWCSNGSWGLMCPWSPATPNRPCKGEQPELQFGVGGGHHQGLSLGLCPLWTALRLPPGLKQGHWSAGVSASPTHRMPLQGDRTAGREGAWLLGGQLEGRQGWSAPRGLCSGQVGACQARLWAVT